MTATSSNEYIQGSNSSTTNTISKAASIALVTHGTGDAFNPVNHDYDTIWLWINPLELYSVFSDDSTKIQWNGYAYDPNDVNGLDIVGIQVGFLNRHFCPCVAVDNILARTWAANQSWPTGQGPGITAADITNILTADPFTNVSYTSNQFPTPLPITTADKKFTQIAFPPNPITYLQSGPGNGGGTTTSYDTQTTNTQAVAQGASRGYSQTYGVDVNIKGHFFIATFESNLQRSKTTSSTHSWLDTLTTTQSHTNALSITGPGCPQPTAPCVPSYTGPGQFIVYQDNVYGTFEFQPKP
jgi:hypothetical protein